MKQGDFTELLSECCRIGFASIEDYDESERMKIQEFLPDVKTVIVVAHHVRHSLEWVWFRFLADGSDETCPADLHTKLILEKVCNKLMQNGFNGIILPYPGQCGVMFKTLAVKTGLGQLGDSFLFMNADWGPWVHLRAILTDAEIEFEKPVTQEACTHCGKCIEACLSGAIMENDFDGIKCRDSMRQIKSTLGDTPYAFECEVCLRACPVGEKPREVLITYGKK
jgi:epoxyqueuosine reductase